MRLAAILLVGAALAGCVAGPAVGGETIAVDVLVTEGFGRRVVLEATAHVPPDASALAALVDVAEVETSHGGGFVEAIDGIDAGARDWFYDVDGLAPAVGPRQRTMTPGAVQHWDLHRWDHVTSPGGSLATWPAPIEGWTPAVLGPDTVVDALDGRPVASPTGGPLAMVGAWNATGLVEVSDRAHARGFHVHVDADGFEVHQPTGGTDPASDRVRAHVALAANPWGDAGDPLLLVRGRTGADALDAWEAFRDRDGRHAHSYVLVDGTLREVVVP